MIIETLAWVGALLSCLLSVPQLVRALHSDRLDGVSSTTYWLVLVNATVWGVWALLAGQYAAGVPGLVNGPAAVLIIARLRRAHRATDQLGGTPVELRTSSETWREPAAGRRRAFAVTLLARQSDLLVTRCGCVICRRPGW